MLNSNTRTVLKQLSAINPSMIITYPVTTVIMGKSIQAFLDLEQLKEDKFDEIGLFNISEFNSIVEVIENPVITNDDGVLTIKNDKSSIKYGSTSIDIIESECRGNPELINKIKQNTKVLEFELSAKELDNIKKMSNLLKELSDLVIMSKGSEIEICIKSVEKSSNNYTVSFEGEVTEDVQMSLVMDMVNKLPSSSFKVSVYKSKKGSLLAVFSSVNVPGLDIVISAKA
jgi:hypothetical protein